MPDLTALSRRRGSVEETPTAPIPAPATAPATVLLAGPAPVTPPASSEQRAGNPSLLESSPSTHLPPKKGGGDDSPVAITQSPNHPSKRQAVTTLVPPLPEPLAALVRAASAGVLPPGPVKLDTGQADSLKDYTLGWAAAYLLGDREHALSELWRAYGAWPKRADA